MVSAIKRHVDRAGGAEVELLLERDGTLYPVETKLTCNPTRRTVSGILAFRVAYRDRKIGIGTVPCAVDEPRWIAEDALALPWNLSRPTHHATP